MSSYELQKLIHHVNRNPDSREKYQQNAGQFADGHQLEPAERQAILNLNIRKVHFTGA